MAYRGRVHLRRASAASGNASEKLAGPGHVYRVTSARLAVPDDVAGRQRRYLVSMTIRTLCFVGAIIASGWLRWLLLAGAVVLPYVSVVFANGGREQGGDFPGEQPRPLGLPPVAGTGDEHTDEHKNEHKTGEPGMAADATTGQAATSGREDLR